MSRINKILNEIYKSNKQQLDNKHESTDSYISKRDKEDILSYTITSEGKSVTYNLNIGNSGSIVNYKGREDYPDKESTNFPLFHQVSNKLTLHGASTSGFLATNL